MPENADQLNELDDEDRDEADATGGEEPTPATTPSPADAASPAVADKVVAEAVAAASPAPVAPRAAPGPRSTPVQAERSESARVVLTEAPLAAAVATAFSLPPLPPIPEKPASPGIPATDVARPVETNIIADGEANPARESASAVVAPKEAAAPAPVPAPAPLPSMDTAAHAEPSHAALNGHAAPAPAVVQPRQGDLLGHVEAANTPAPAASEAKPDDAPTEEESRQDAAP